MTAPAGSTARPHGCRRSLSGARAPGQRPSSRGARAALPRRARQQGRTLVELMVSVTIGLAITLGLVATFAASSSASRASLQIADAESLGGILMATIGPSIRMAGFGEIVVAGDAPATLFDGAAVLGCESGTFRNPAAGDFTCDPGATGDALAVRFQAGNVRAAPQTARAIRDCLGGDPPVEAMSAPGGTLATAGFQRPMVVNVFRRNGAGELVCFGNGAGVEQPLMAGVEEFRVYYGFDDTGFAAARSTARPNPLPRATSIRGADWINAQRLATSSVDPWNSVVAVHVCVRVRTADRGVSVQGARAFATCPASAGDVNQPLPQASASDGAVRRTVMQTFTIQARASGNALSGLVQSSSGGAP